MHDFCFWALLPIFAISLITKYWPCYPFLSAYFFVCVFFFVDYFRVCTSASTFYFACLLSRSPHACVLYCVYELHNYERKIVHLSEWYKWPPEKWLRGSYSGCELYFCEHFKYWNFEFSRHMLDHRVMFKCQGKLFFNGFLYFLMALWNK